MSARGVIDAETAAELEAIDTAREAAFAALRDANRRGVTGADLDAMLVAMAVVDERIEALKRKTWPRYRGRLVVALGMACLMSPTGRSSRLLWQRAGRAA